MVFIMLYVPFAIVCAWLEEWRHKLKTGIFVRNRVHRARSFEYVSAIGNLRAQPGA
jgi:hypothetical protein